MGTRIDMMGVRSGRLEVIAPAPTKNRQACWVCQCDCGEQVTVAGASLRKGLTQSCGCLFAETWTRHGMAHTREYNSWSAMRHRCMTPTANSYDRYGGRGIQVCDEWKDSFEQFYRDMGPRPEGTTLDRINNDGHYQPSNCRWATYAEQRQNQTAK